jgi:tetratricopeptide (TPR) repeat protein
MSMKMLVVALFSFVLSAHAQDAPDLIRQAIVAITAKDYAGAIKLLDDALRADPKSSEAWRNKARVRLIEKDYKQSRADATRAIELDPQNYRAWAGRAAALLNLKEPAHALDDATRAVTLKPDYAYSQAVLGDAYYDLKRWKEAADAYTESVRLDPKRAGAWSSRGSAKLNMGDARGAIDDLSEAARLDAAIPNTFYNRGVARMQVKDFAGADKDFAKSIEMGYDAASAREQRAKAMEGLAAAVKNDTVEALPSSQPIAITVKDSAAAVRALPAADIGYAIEGLRMMTGIGKQEKAWGAKWQPYFDYPSPEVIDYFKKLNPVVEEMQAMRAASMQAISDFDGAWAEAVLSRAAGDTAGVAGALAAAERHVQVVRSAGTRMAQLQKRAEELGNPPDAKAAKARAKAWMKGKTNECSQLAKYAYQWRLVQVASSNLDIRAVNMAASLQGQQPKRSELAWPAVEPDWCQWVDGGKAGPEPTGTAPSNEVLNKAGSWVNSVYVTAGVEADLKIYFFQNVPAERAAKEIVEKGKVAPWALPGYKAPASAPPVNLVAETPKPSEVPKDSKEAQEESRWKAEAVAEKEDIIRLIQRNLSRDEAEWSGEKDVTRKEALYLRVLNNRSAILQEQDLMRSLKTGEYVHTRTPSDQYCHDLMIVRTVEHNEVVADTRRTAAAMEKMAANAEPDQVNQLRDFVARQVTAKDLAEGNIGKVRQAAQAVFDSVQGRREQRAASALEEALRNDDYLTRAERVKTIAGVTLLVTGVAAPIYAGSAATAAGAGGEAATAIAEATAQAATAVNMTYGGATGFVEGGPVEMIKQSVGMSGMPGMVVSEMMTGYQRGGLVSGGGAVGALERGAESFLMAKGVEGVAKRLGAWWAGGEKSAASAPPPPKMTVGDMLEGQEFQLAKNLAQQRINRLQQTAARIRDLRAKGASGAEIAALEARQLQQATAVSEDLLAKRMLKAAGKQARAGQGDAALGQLEQDYAGAVETIHRTQVDPAFNQAVRAAKYQWRRKKIGGTWERAGEPTFRDIRHAGAEGTVNTDRDKALNEMANDGEYIYQLYKDDKPINLTDAEHDLQQIYNQSYNAATGGSAQMAQHSITTSRSREAYKDLTYTHLNDPENVGRINKGWAGQSVEVLQAKVTHAGPGQGDFANLFRKIDGANQAAKDIDKRLLPILQAQQKAALGPRAGEIAQDMEKWRSIQQALERVETDPVGASRELRVLTGMDSIGEVSDAIGKRFLGAVKLQ